MKHLLLLPAVLFWGKGEKGRQAGIRRVVDIWGNNPATLEFSNLILGLIWSIVRERVEVEVEQV